jgi:NADH-quinone oxidoreductase subunit L
MNLPVWHTFTHWLEETLGHMHVVEFAIWIAALSSVVAVIAIIVAWFVYGRVYQRQRELPSPERPDDPLRPILGPVFTLLEDKYRVDELYWTVIVNPYVSLARFLADSVDWRFWHDWFHDSVITAGYNALSTLISVRIDLGIIDAAANKIADWVKLTAEKWSRIETGYVRNYALSVFIGVVLILGFLILTK